MCSIENIGLYFSIISEGFGYSMLETIQFSNSLYYNFILKKIFNLAFMIEGF